MDQISFTIMHIDDSRYEKMSRIKNILFFYPEVYDIEFINGRNVEQVKRMRQKYPLARPRPDIWTPKVGELGVWYSQIQCWNWAAENNRHLIVFEDDAMLSQNFESIWHGLLEELPSDYDFFSLFVPNNQEGDYFQRVAYDEFGAPSSTNYAHDEISTFNFGAQNLARAYQGYSCVATMYSPKGARKLLDLVNTHGMWSTVDCFLFLEAHRGNLEAYAPKPSMYVERMVDIDWTAPTTIQNTELVDHQLISD